MPSDTSPTPARGDKVTMATRIFLPEPAAASFRLGAVSRALLDGGADVQVLTSKYEDAPSQSSFGESTEAAESGTILRWPVLRDKSGYLRGYLPYLSFDAPLFVRLMGARKPSIVLVEPPPTTGLFARLACSIRGVPYVWYAADVWSDATKIAGAPAPVVAAVRAMEKFAIKGASGVIAVSEGVAERAKQLGAKSVRVVPNGIDTDVYRPDVAPLSDRELGDLGINGRYLVYAGTASEWQGAEIFAEAMDLLAGEDSELQAVFVGQGTRWDRIAEIADQLRQKYGRDVVVQVPPTSPETVAKLLKGAELALVSIVPGEGYDFAYPTKVLAALATGTPVLYAGVGPVADDLETNRLGIVSGFSAAQIAKAIREGLPSLNSDFDPDRLHRWVVENRSMKSSAESAASYVLSFASREGPEQ